MFTGRTRLFLFSGEVKDVFSNQNTSNNLISHSYHELKEIEGEKERVLKEEYIPT